MTELEKDIDDVIEDLSLGSEIKKCVPNESSKTVSKAKEIFVLGNPRSWWLSLKNPFKAYHYPDSSGYLHITSYIPIGEEWCWFIPEVEEDIMPVYDTKINVIPKLLSECYCFEYYLVSKDFQWILIENDHNEVILSENQKR